MTTTVHISDFKDFKGLQEACNYYSSSIIEKGNTILKFSNVNPYNSLQYFKGCYNEALLIARENGFDMVRVEFLLNTLKYTGSELIETMETRMCYTENHIKRQL